jgi:hypothetical protein
LVETFSTTDAGWSNEKGCLKASLVASLVSRFNHACFATSGKSSFGSETFGAPPFDPRAKGAATDAGPAMLHAPEGVSCGVSVDK